VADPADDWLARVEAAVLDGQAELSTSLGGQRESSMARLWRGQVLVDWEADEQAGGCLVRPRLLRRMVALGAGVRRGSGWVEVRASGRVLAALSSEHAELVRRLGGAERVDMRTMLRFQGERYAGGEERYVVVQGGRQQPLLRLTARVSQGAPRSLRPTR
jgi:hypothetical protein